MFLLYFKENNYTVNKILIKLLEFSKLFIYKPLNILKKSFIIYK